MRSRPIIMFVIATYPLAPFEIYLPFLFVWFCTTGGFRKKVSMCPSGSDWSLVILTKVKVQMNPHIIVAGAQISLFRAKTSFVAWFKLPACRANVTRKLWRWRMIVPWGAAQVVSPFNYISITTLCERGLRR